MNPELYYEDVEIGDDIGPVERLVNRDQVAAFLHIRGGMPGLSRFTDDASAQDEGLPEAIVPGGMTIALASQLLTGWSPTVTLKKLEVSFRQVVPHNSSIHLKGIVTDKHVVDDEPQIECDVFIENEEGGLHVIGNATIVLPKRGTSLHRT
jgi:acyl dehydratase